MQQYSPHTRASGSDLHLHEQLQDLTRRTTAELRVLWQRHYQVQVPRGLSRDLLIRFIAWHLQEEVLGSLRKATLRRLATWKLQFEHPVNADAPPRSASLKPGTTLLREWNGTTHTVQVAYFADLGRRFHAIVGTRFTPLRAAVSR